MTLASCPREIITPSHVAEELADGRKRGMADALQVGDQGGQPRPDQAAVARSRAGSGGVMHLAAVGAPARVAPVLLDQERHRGDIDLLDDAGRSSPVGPQPVAAAGADVQEVIVAGAW